MASKLQSSRDHFIEGTSSIARFWGFPKAMGAIYGAIYLAPEPLSLDDLVQQTALSKGAVSTNVRTLQRLQMVQKRVKLGDRRDFYEAETDFWKVVRSVLKERERTEFDRALRAVAESLQMAERAATGRSESKLKAFYVDRLGAMKRFFDLLDGIVAALLALDDMRLNALRKTLGRSTAKKAVRPRRP
jgi:DNA-binding transcriptional regulator GbsR (MarR family)